MNNRARNTRIERMAKHNDAIQKMAEYCAEHKEVDPIDDNGIDRCPVCEHATSTTMDEAVRFASQD